MSKKPYCIIIPAIKKNAAIPDQLVKKLNGITLIQRAINTVKEFNDDADIYIVTDSIEISLIAERNNVNVFYKQSLNFTTLDILTELRFFNIKRASEYRHLIIFRASTPLVNAGDIQDAYTRFCEEDGDILVTLKRENHRLWKEGESSINNFFFISESEKYYSEIRAFMMLHSRTVLDRKEHPKVIPWELDDNAVEINSYQDWWICEKLLSRKRILFVVAGNPKIGMGHIYRSLTLAHEVHEHEVLFLCTRNSELAVRSIAEKDYKTYLQKNDMVEDILSFEPDLVINDMLNTEADTILALKSKGIRVVNFEDLGSGSTLADLTINELYEQPLLEGDNFRWGKKYYLLRDEFIDANIRQFPEKVETLLLTFGGTDPNNYTLKVLRLILPVCIEQDIRINLVIGSGYTFLDELEEFLAENNDDKRIIVHSSTPVMSRIMEQCDIAIAANGRTVYELAHMRIPSLILSHYEREDTHDAAVEDYGFIHIGMFHDQETANRILEKFNILINDTAYRQKLYANSGKLDFAESKNNLIAEILKLL